jgi:hypothetical protein
MQIPFDLVVRTPAGAIRSLVISAGDFTFVNLFWALAGPLPIRNNTAANTQLNRRMARLLRYEGTGAIVGAHGARGNRRNSQYSRKL